MRKQARSCTMLAHLCNLVKRVLHSFSAQNKSWRSIFALIHYHTRNSTLHHQCFQQRTISLGTAMLRCTISGNATKSIAS